MSEALKDLPWFDVEGHQRMPHGKLPRFFGELQAPIIQSLSNQPILHGAANIDGAMNTILSQRIEKLILLLKHYKLDRTTDPWVLLSLRLACAFVPGLRVLQQGTQGRGRPKGAKKWTSQTRDDLIAAVQSIRSERAGRSITNSIRILKQREPQRWASVSDTRYYEALRDRELRDEATRAVIALKVPSAPR
jgi:hypothetical protein